MPQFDALDAGDPYLSRRSYDTVWPFSFSAFTGTILAGATGRSVTLKGVQIEAVVTTDIGATDHTMLFLTNTGSAVHVVPVLAIPAGATAGTHFSARVLIPDGVTFEPSLGLGLSRTPTPATGAIRVSGYAWGELQAGTYQASTTKEPPVGYPLNGNRAHARKFADVVKSASGSALSSAARTANIWVPASATNRIRIKGYSIAAAIATTLTASAATEFGIMDTSSDAMVLPLIAFSGAAMPTTSFYQLHANLGDGILLGANKTAGVGFGAAISSGTFYQLSALWGSEES